MVIHEHKKIFPLPFHMAFFSKVLKYTTLCTRHNINLLIILMRSISITKVAEKVIPSQMPEEIIIVHEARVTELAQGMASMAAVISVSLATVLSQL